MRRLKEKVAVVTGASRNAGRGIAFVLGQEGATVYVTGRSVRGNQTAQWPEVASEDTIQDTAEQVTKRVAWASPCSVTTAWMNRSKHSLTESSRSRDDSISWSTMRGEATETSMKRGGTPFGNNRSGAGT